MKYLLFLSLLFISSSCSAQIFKPLPKYVPPTFSSRQKIVIIDTLPPVTHDTTFSGFRVSGPMVLYALPNSTIFTGIGIDYEHDTYKTSTRRWYCDWAVAIGVYAGGQFAPTGLSGVTAVGLSVSVLNKFLTVGALYNVTTKMVQGAVGPSANLVPQN